METLKELIQNEKPSVVVAVGDIVSRNMVEFGISVDLLIVDNKTMRKPIDPLPVDAEHIIHASNPAGVITFEAWDAIKKALQNKGRTKLLIDGEEDLLTVVTVLSAPLGAFVVYGQPRVGVVVIRVGVDSRKNMQRIVDLMVVSSKS
jgi:uncharacterized protein (UPF0218 family)